jgi:cell division protein FtsL
LAYIDKFNHLNSIFSKQPEMCKAAPYYAQFSSKDPGQKLALAENELSCLFTIKSVFLSQSRDLRIIFCHAFLCPLVLVWLSHHLKRLHSEKQQNSSKKTKADNLFERFETKGSSMTLRILNPQWIREPLYRWMELMGQPHKYQWTQKCMTEDNAQISRLTQKHRLYSKQTRQLIFRQC